MIGNPPYIKEYENRQAFNGFRETSPYYIGKMDLWYGFACHGIDLLCKNGVLCFIAQNNWTTSSGAKKMRKKVLEDTRILQLIDFNAYMVFESASIQTMVMLFQKDSVTDNYTLENTLLNANATKDDLLKMLSKEQTQNITFLHPKLNRKYFAGKLITFSNNDNLFEKIAKDCEYLNENEATNGIHPHYDFVNNKINRQHPWTKIGEGIFGLSSEEKKSLGLSKKELEFVKPYYTSEQVKRYYTNSKNDLWIIYTDSSFKNPNSMDNYPNLKAHLDKFKNVISSDNKPYGLHRAREEKFFKGEKIVSQRKCVGQPSFSYSDFDCYVSATFYVIQTSRFNLKYLTGLLNSKLIAFWLRNKGKMQGENYQIDKEPLMQIPLKIPTKEIQDKIVSCVDKILTTKKSDNSADTSNLEQQIDILVYKLYGLTYDEVLVIDPNFALTKGEYEK